ncbi:hypothetical protein GW17_00005829 [Ensete ventricosum]|nr:hypothetical protein GW17_00005829 [Ensete ventricosum]
MEEIAEGVNNLHIAAPDSYKNNRIQVSNTKKPLFFYVNLAKARNPLELVAFWCPVEQPRFASFDSFRLQVRRYMQQHNEVELSALGMGTVSPLLCVLNFLSCERILL